MKNSFYSGILNGLSKVNLNGFERAQAERHMRRAAAIVEMLMGSPAVEAPVAADSQNYRKAA